MDDPFLAQLKQDIQQLCEEKYGHVSVVFDELVPQGDNKALSALRSAISTALSRAIMGKQATKASAYGWIP